MSGLADYDRERGNLLADVANMRRELEEIKRWAAPVATPLLPNPPAIKAWRTSALSINDITQTVVTGLTDSLEEEGLELEDGSSIIKLRRDSAAEWYAFGIMLQFAANVSNNRVLRMQVRNINTGSWAGEDWTIIPAAVNGLETVISTTIIYRMAETDDAVRFQVYQDSGGALNLNLFLLNAVMVKSGDVAAG